MKSNLFQFIVGQTHFSAYRHAKMSFDPPRTPTKFFAQTFTLPPSIHRQLTEHGRSSKNNQSWTNSHVKLEANYSRSFEFSSSNLTWKFVNQIQEQIEAQVHAQAQSRARARAQTQAQAQAIVHAHPHAHAQVANQQAALLQAVAKIHMIHQNIGKKLTNTTFKWKSA